MLRMTLLGIVLMLACTKVVTTTTQEVRPLRYALVEITERPAAFDSLSIYARRALAAEGIKEQTMVNTHAPVVSEPIHFAAEGMLPALDASVTFTVVTREGIRKVRIYASAVLEPNAVGGVDPRLTALVQRLAQHFQ